MSTAGFSLMGAMRERIAAVGPPQNNRIDQNYLYQLVSSTTYIVINIMALPGEVFLRRNFGERYLDPVMFVIGYFFTLFFTLITGFMGSENGGLGLGIIAQFYLFFGAYHFVWIFIRNLRGIPHHSMCPGEPWSFVEWPTNVVIRLFIKLLSAKYQDHTLTRGIINYTSVLGKLITEPFLWVFGGGFLSLLLGDGVLVFFFWTGIAMFIRGQMDRFFSRQQQLDFIDKRLEAKWETEALTGSRAPREMGGYTVYSPALTPAAQATLKDAIETLDPRALRMMEQAESALGSQTVPEPDEGSAL